MLTILLRSFEVSTEHVFTKAVPYEEAQFTAFSEAMVKAFGNVLRTTDISLDPGDHLYKYRLSLGMFNGSADVILTSAGLKADFRTGRTKADLRIVIGCVVALETLAQHFSVQCRQVTFAVHATFQSEEDFRVHMSTVADKDRGYTAGGVTWHCPGGNFDGQIRFSTDKSLMLDHGLFLAYQVSTPEGFSKELLAKLESRFTEVLKDLELELDSPE